MIQDMNRSREDLSSRNSSNSSCHRSILLVLFLGSSLTISFLTNVSNYSPFYPSLPKQRTLVASMSRLPFLFLAFIRYHWRYFIGYRQRPPNLVNPVWFWGISRGIWANQKQKNILSEGLKELILWLLVQHTQLYLFLKVQSHKWRWSWKATVFSSLLTKRGNFCSLRYLTKQLEWKDSNQEMHVSRLSDVINTRWNVTIRSSYPSDREASSSTSEFTADSDRKTVSKAKIRYGFSMLCEKDGFYLPELIMTWGKLCYQFCLSFSGNN